MNRYCTFAIATLAGALAVPVAAAGRERGQPGDGADATQAAPAHATLPPVLRRYEPTDSVLVTLPGAPARPAPSKTSTPIPAPTPDTHAVPVDLPKLPTPSSGPVASAFLKRTPPGEEESRPILRRAPKPVFPPDFERDSAIFCQKRIGQWTKSDAYNLLGDSLRERPAFSDEKAENGHIYAFSDPTRRYQALELDFAADTGLLRTVFVYPWSMTWMECRRVWGAKVTATEANNGRTFYSYQNRRLDVLVEPGGKVVSLGLY